MRLEYPIIAAILLAGWAISPDRSMTEPAATDASSIYSQPPAGWECDDSGCRLIAPLRVARRVVHRVTPRAVPTETTAEFIVPLAPGEVLIDVEPAVTVESAGPTSSIMTRAEARRCTRQAARVERRAERRSVGFWRRGPIRRCLARLVRGRR
jgi:hypothetical protein